MEKIKIESFFGCLLECKPATDADRDELSVINVPYGFVIEPLLYSKHDWAINATVITLDNGHVSWIVVEARRGEPAIMRNQGTLEHKTAAEYLTVLINELIAEAVAAKKKG